MTNPASTSIDAAMSTGIGELPVPGRRGFAVGGTVVVTGGGFDATSTTYPKS